VRKSGSLVAIAVLGCLSGAVITVLSAQSGSSSRSAESSVLPELLTEVRGLRKELALAASASVRTNILMGRVQLQERRIHEVSQQLTNAEQTAAQMRAEINELETRLTAAREGEQEPRGTPAEREAAREWVKSMEPILKEKKQRHSELRAQYSELQNVLGTEQARWAEFSGRLDELERSLSALSAPLR
jgi:uncharacterized coiled-coil protein SlyX